MTTSYRFIVEGQESLHVMLSRRTGQPAHRWRKAVLMLENMAGGLRQNLPTAVQLVETLFMDPVEAVEAVRLSLLPDGEEPCKPEEDQS